MSQYSKEEKETYMNTTEADKTATLYSNSRNWIERMRRLAAEYPDKVFLEREDENGASFVFPKSWMKVRPPRQISEEQRRQAAERLLKYRKERQEQIKAQNKSDQ